VPQNQIDRLIDPGSVGDRFWVRGSRYTISLPKSGTTVLNGICNYSPIWLLNASLFESIWP